MRIDESQKTSICRSSTTINQPLTGRNRRKRPKCVNPVLPASLIMWDELVVVSNTGLYFTLCTHKTNPYLQNTLELSTFFDHICDQLKCATAKRNVAVTPYSSA